MACFGRSKRVNAGVIIQLKQRLATLSAHLPDLTAALILSPEGTVVYAIFT